MKKKEDLIKQIKFENSSDTFSFGYEANWSPYFVIKFIF